METDFLASTNHFLYIFSEIPAGERFFSVQWKLIFEQILYSSYWRKRFLPNEDRYFTSKFFSASENRHCFEWKPVFKDRTYSCWWKLIFWLVEKFSSIVSYIFQGGFHPS